MTAPAAAPPSLTPARLVARRQLASQVVMWVLEAPAVAAAAEPLQFVQVAVPTGPAEDVTAPASTAGDRSQEAPAGSTGGWSGGPPPLTPGRPLLRRPFSVYDADPARGAITLVFRVVGPGTALMASLPTGAAVDLLGPLGRPAAPAVGGRPAAGEILWLVAYGWQWAALRFLAVRALQRGMAVQALVVAEGEAAEVLSRLWRDEPAAGEALGRSPHPGSAQPTAELRVVAPQELSPWLDQALPAAVAVPAAGTGHRPAGGATQATAGLAWPRLFAAGPPDFLAAVQWAVQGKAVEAYLVVDTPMPCGYGACLGCAVAVRESGRIRYRRACADGRWFSAGEVIL